MISVLISAQNDERALARTLSVLVQGAVFGIIGDVTILVDDPSDATNLVADHAGCHVFPHYPLLETVKTLRSDWVLILEAGAVLELGWVETIQNYMLVATGAVHFKRSPRRPRSLWERITKREEKLALGVLMSKGQALMLLKADTNVANLAKLAKPIALNATIMPNKIV